MDKPTAQRVVAQTFKASFDRDRFRDFINELTNGFDETKKQSMLIPEAFKPHVSSCQRIGTYESPESELADVLIVQLTESYKLERSRTALRNFVAHKLKRGDGDDNSYKEAALVAFVSPDSKSWRFSFVRMEYETKRDPKSGKIKPEERLTPARRYSYLVGADEQCHTAQTRFLPLLQDTKFSPTLTQIEEAFSVEKVTDEFFEQYKALFQKLAEHLKTEPWFQRDSDEECEQLVTRFAKKLLGQIVFLYFLQKKGWLGVRKDEPWGTGPKNFMRQRYETNAEAGGNYYHDCLQYLFYEALADERKGQADPGYYARFDCRLPFLNGGLFEADYDWRHETISIPDRLFHNEDKTKSEVGTGILNVFNRYNFTIKEDEPLEKEVAVDPEMLGKVFENMLEVTERKSKGAFYTPREIVHYMCQESLIHYLEKAVGPESESEVPKAALEWLIRKGHLALENDEIAIKAQERILQGQQKSSKHHIEAPLAIEKKAADIDAALAKIKVCDPAIGSGAFPVGMLHEIVQAREVLGVLQSAPARPYDLKKHAIGHSIYGVDIDPSAIDIARLRLWLSLIVDEDDYDEIDALPNLDYKIMQGNSLIEEYEGVKLFDKTFIGEDEDTFLVEEKKRCTERRGAIQREYIKGIQNGEPFDARRAELDQELETVNATLKKIETVEKKAAKRKVDQAEGLFDLVSEARKKAKLLEARQDEFFEASSSDRKCQLRDEITRLEWELIEATLQEQGKTDALAKLETFKNSGEKPYFLWKLNFSEVFRQKGGFDVVIGNPPYFNIDTFGAKSPIQEYLKRKYSVYMDKSDILFYFFERSRYLSTKGIVAFITSNAYLSAAKAKLLRRFFVDRNLVRKVANFEEYMVFKEASITTAITFLFESSLPPRFLNLKGKKYQKESLMSVLQDESRFSTSGNWTEDSFIFYQDDINTIVAKIDSANPRLGDLYLVGSGMQTGSNKVFLFENSPPDFPASYMRPRISGENIEKYVYSYSSEKVLYVEEVEDWEDLDPSVKLYLNSHKQVLSNRADKKRRPSAKWWNFTFAMHMGHYDKDKIWCSYRAPENQFCLDRTGQMIGLTNTTVIFKTNNSINFCYLLALLNSECLNFRYSHIGKKTGSGLLEYFENGISKIPIHLATTVTQNQIGTLVEYIIYSRLTNKMLAAAYFEQLIDGLVYELYFPEQIQAAEMGILPHLGELTPIDENMSDEEKLVIIQREFDRLYAPRHPVRNKLETLDSVPVVHTIREALKR